MVLTAENGPFFSRRRAGGAFAGAMRFAVGVNERVLFLETGDNLLDIHRQRKRP